MKNLGDLADDASVSNGRKSNGKFDNDWTMKVEIKLQKLNRALKLLMNKINDMRNVSGNKRSQSVLSGISDSSLRFRNPVAAIVGSTPGLQKNPYNDFVEDEISGKTFENINGKQYRKLGTSSLSPRGLNPDDVDLSKLRDIYHGPPIPTNKLMMKISEFINYTLRKSTELSSPVYESKPRTGHYVFPVVEDVNNYLIINENGRPINTAATSPKQANKVIQRLTIDKMNFVQGGYQRSLGGPLSQIQNTNPSTDRGTPNITARVNDSVSNQSSIQQQVNLAPIGSKQYQGRTHPMTPNQDNGMLATFSNPNQTKPLYTINEENNILKQQ